MARVSAGVLQDEDIEAITPLIESKLGTETLANYVQSGTSTIQHFLYRAQHKGNLCPQCNEFTLMFDAASVLFD
jgi:hypothetical protein